MGEGPNWTGLTPGGRERGGGGRDGGRPLLVAMMVGWFSYTSSSSSPSPAPLTKKLSEPECWPLVVKRFPSEPNSSHEGDVVNALKRKIIRSATDMRPRSKINKVSTWRGRAARKKADPAIQSGLQGRRSLQWRNIVKHCADEKWEK